MKMFGKRALSYFLTICVIMSTIFVTVSAQTVDSFSDFPNDWSTEAVTAAVQNGLLNGYDDGTIRAGANLTRAEMATIINRAFGAVIEADISSYKDVSKDAWYYKEIAKGVNMGTFQGGGDGYMNPENPITREETFAVIARALVLSETDLSTLDKFVDKNKISSWATNYVAALVKLSYVNGDESSCINPGDYITRAEFATIMHNNFKKYISASGTYNNETINGSLMINKGPITLTNMVVNGDLVIGDGVHTSDVVLKNVVVNGRLLVRGAQKPAKTKLEKTTAKNGILVNNVNGIVYFDNYRTDSQFVKLVENTPAEFKTASTGGGGGGGGGGTGGGSTTTQYTLTFNTNGGSTIAPVNVNAGVEFDVSSYVPTKTGFIFGGWYLDAGLTSPVVGNKITLSQDTEIYAKWITQYTVTFMDNGGVVKVVTVEKDALLSTALSAMPAAPYIYNQMSSTSPIHNHGVKQIGWFDSSRKEYTLDTKIESDNIILYPGWKEFSATFKTDRIENMQPIFMNIIYHPDDRLIDTVTDFVFGNRNTIISGLTLNQNKILSHTVTQKLLSEDKQIKLLNLNVSFGDVFGSTARFKQLFDTQIAQLLSYFPSSVRADAEAKLDIALDDIAQDGSLNLKTDNVFDMIMPLREVLGSEAELRTLLTDPTINVLNNITDPIVKATLQAEINTVVDFIVASDNTNKDATLPSNRIIQIDVAIPRLGDLLNYAIAVDGITTFEYDDYKADLLSDPAINAVVTALGDDEALKTAFNTIVAPGVAGYPYPSDIPLSIDVNVSELVLKGLVKELRLLQWTDVESMLDQKLIDLCDETYLAEQFIISRNDLADHIEQSLGKTTIKSEVFLLDLAVDAYNVLLKKLDTSIAGMSYDTVKDKIPTKVIKLIGGEILKREVNNILTDFKGRINEVVTKNNNTDLNDDVQKLDCRFKMTINIVKDYVIPEYERYIEAVKEKLGNYYDNNLKLQEIVGKLEPEDIFEEVSVVQPGFTGYKLKTETTNPNQIAYGAYYTMLEEVTKAADGAIAKAAEDADTLGMDKVEKLVSDYVDLTYEYYGKIKNLAEVAIKKLNKPNIKLDKILPSDSSLDSKKAKIKELAVKMVDDPGMSVKEAVTLGVSWDTFLNLNKTITKKQETITLKNITKIIDLGD